MKRSGALFSALLLAGCGAQAPEASPCVPVSLGLRPTRSGLDWLRPAVVDANALLAGQSMPLQLMDESGARDPKTIPVWPVAASNLTPMQTAFVPPGCRAIFVQTGALAQRVGQWNGDLATGLSIEPAAIASWILLHEAGHLHDHQQGYLEPAPAVRGENYSDTDQKRIELAADAFAAARIRGADASQPYPIFMAGMRARQALTQLSWNLQRDRQLGMFGATALATPSAFGDVGDTHPNLEYRTLITLVLIDQTPEAQQLLDDFITTRMRAPDPSPRVWYQREVP